MIHDDTAPPCDCGAVAQDGAITHARQCRLRRYHVAMDARQKRDKNAADLAAYVRQSTNVDIDPVEILRNIVRHIGATGHGSRWSLFGSIAGHGSGVSSAIVAGLGFDPDETVGGCTTCKGTGGCLACEGDGSTLSDDDELELVDCPDCGGDPRCDDCHGTGADIVRQMVGR